jgi:ADP-ribose pyrophosphatase YjhB (NUDIX family)
MIGVGAVIEDGEGKVLLVRHRPERGGYWQGKWICPGGRLEAGETIEEGIRREVEEETRLTIELVRPLTPFDRIVRDEEGEMTLHVVYIDYLAKLVGGTLEARSDVGEGRWVTRQELKRIWDELHEDTQRLMRIAGIVS